MKTFTCTRCAAVLAAERERVGAEVAERHGAVLAAVLAAVLDEHGLSIGDERVRDAVARHVAAITGAGS